MSELLVSGKAKMREIREEGHFTELLEKMKELQEDINIDPAMIEKLANLNKFRVNRGRTAETSQQTPLMLPDTEGQTRLMKLAGVQKLQKAVKSRKFDFLKYMLG